MEMRAERSAFSLTCLIIIPGAVIARRREGLLRRRSLHRDEVFRHGEAVRAHNHIFFTSLVPYFESSVFALHRLLHRPDDLAAKLLGKNLSISYGVYVPAHTFRRIGRSIDRSIVKSYHSL